MVSPYKPDKSLKQLLYTGIIEKPAHCCNTHFLTHFFAYLLLQFVSLTVFNQNSSRAK